VCIKSLPHFRSEANIISLNKEGIFSLFGYWGLYLVSVNLGYHLFFLKKPISSRVASIGGKSSIAIEVWLLDGFLWVLTIFLDKFVEKISRRMCNLAYVTFVLAQNFEVLRKWAVASDGTQVPISIVSVKLDGTDPLLLYVYGSYEVCIEPEFRTTWLSLIDRGFVYAIAHIRSGGEMGRKWYEDGKLLKKRNTLVHGRLIFVHHILQ